MTKIFIVFLLLPSLGLCMEERPQQKRRLGSGDSERAVLGTPPVEPGASLDQRMIALLEGLEATYRPSSFGPSLSSWRIETSCPISWEVLAANVHIFATKDNLRTLTVNGLLDSPAGHNEQRIRGLSSFMGQNKGLKELRVVGKEEYDETPRPLTYEPCIRSIAAILANGIRVNPLLESLHLSELYFQKEHFEELGRALGECRSLKVLELTSYQFEGNIPTGIEAVLRSPSIETLTLQNSFLDKEAIEALERIAEGGSLKNLSLKDSKFLEGMIPNIHRIIEKLSSVLITLNLEGVSWLKGLLPLLASQEFPCLETLNLCADNLEEIPGDEGVGLLRNCPVLRNVNLSNFAITWEGMEIIKAAVREETKVSLGSINVDRYKGSSGESKEGELLALLATGNFKGTPYREGAL